MYPKAVIKLCSPKYETMVKIANNVNSVLDKHFCAK
jgi:hypothetical protein